MIGFPQQNGAPGRSRTCDPRFRNLFQPRRQCEAFGTNRRTIEPFCLWASVSVRLVLAKVASAVASGVILSACSSPIAPTAARPPELDAVFAFMDADPWVHPLLGEPIGLWVRRQLAGVSIHIDPSLSGDVGARANMKTRELFWQPNTLQVRSASMLLHEARHFQGYRHTCGDFDLAGDRTMDEAGPYAVQIVYLEHAGEPSLAHWLRETYIGCR